jgi:peptidoglycan/xylan/chitin deacetylase (PgdA/CDA1 family)
MPPAPEAANPYLLGLAMLAELPPAARGALLERWLTGVALHAERQMLWPAQVPLLRDAGVAVGAHGASHVPMTLSRNVGGELCGARNRLRAALGTDCESAVTALSFPHGRFDAGIVEAARACGYRLMFTSAPYLSALSGGHLASDVCGRIEIATRHVAPDGRFRRDLLAHHLFLRPAVKTPAEAIATGVASLR